MLISKQLNVKNLLTRKLLVLEVGVFSLLGMFSKSFWQISFIECDFS
jgi:hypothetical protein